MRKAFLAAICIVQLAVPLSLVVKHEQTRSSGTPWKFQTAPVDPDDPYRGKYVRLAYEVESTPVAFADLNEWNYREERAYAELAQGPDGFARLVRLHSQRPRDDVEYVDVFTRHFAERPEGGMPTAMFVRVPFDRYYLPEHRAPQIEQDYLRASREARSNTWAEVRVRDGHAALVSLVLDGKPVQP